MVLSGGIRRSAMISLFSIDDEEMLYCKSGSWWELNPQRGRANNSGVFLRGVVKKNDFKNFWKVVKESGSGEPGIFFSNDPNQLTNPCFAGSTKIAVADGRGYVEIQQLAKEREDVPVYSVDNDGKVSIQWGRAPRLTRKNQSTVRVHLDDQSYIDVTPHRS